MQEIQHSLPCVCEANVLQTSYAYKEKNKVRAPHPQPPSRWLAKFKVAVVMASLSQLQADAFTTWVCGFVLLCFVVAVCVYMWHEPGCSHVNWSLKVCGCPSDHGGPWLRQEGNALRPFPTPLKVGFVSGAEGEARGRDPCGCWRKGPFSDVTLCGDQDWVRNHMS